jgi:hypothetical protein
VDTLLTLVIAMGGIATGIGAIWTATLARRQLLEQRRFLSEQTERARLTLEYDLLTRMVDRFVGPHLLSMRRATAKYLLDNDFFEDNDGRMGMPSLNSTAVEVCAFFEEVGEMLKLGVLRDELVWTRFSVLGQAYWLLCKPAIERRRQEWQDPTMFVEYEYLCRRMAETDREQGFAIPITQERLRQTMETEAVRGEESPTTTTE